MKSLKQYQEEVKQLFLKDCVSENCDACIRDGEMLDETTTQAYLLGMKRALELLPIMLTRDPKGDREQYRYQEGWNSSRTEIETAITQEIKSIEV